jgi:hypothetical protein
MSWFLRLWAIPMLVPFALLLRAARRSHTDRPAPPRRLDRRRPETTRKHTPRPGAGTAAAAAVDHRAKPASGRPS